MRLLPLSLLCLASLVLADSGLYPPGLQPLINRANVYLSTGQFNDAVKTYSEAIEQSPADYLLYYKRGTAHFSLSRHSQALDDFDKVLQLASNAFPTAHLMKARIYTRDGSWEEAHDSLRKYKGSTADKATADELAKDISEGQNLEQKAEKERKAQLWNACVESTSSALRIASHSISLRELRAECSFGAGDLESLVGDLTRLSHLLPSPTTPPLLVRIFRISYFFLQPSQNSLTPLKTCLHSDPESKQCLPLHRLAKSLDRGFTTLDELLGKEDWRGIIKLLTGSGKNNNLVQRYEEALDEHTKPEMLLGGSETQDLPIPNARKISPRRLVLYRAMCKAYTQSNLPRKAEEWCEGVLSMAACGNDGEATSCENDADGLVGRAEILLAKEEWEEAVRVLEHAFESSGRSRSDIHQRLQKAHRLLKQSKQKDYYKVLGVSRDADQKTIKKAFRMAAKTAHPDKGGTEAKMAAVNEAYEVLSNPELRARFDAGDDPNDPSGGHGPFASGGGGGFGGSGHPFAQFFQQSAGGGQFFQQQQGGREGFKFSFRG